MALIGHVARLMADSIRLPAYGWATESLAATDHRADLNRVSCPTLVVVGSEDTIAPPALSRLLADLIPDARLHTIVGAGHLANQERPVEFNWIVGAFLRSESRSG